MNRKSATIITQQPVHALRNALITRFNRVKYSVAKKPATGRSYIQALTVACTLTLSVFAHAEIVVILPQTGAMANAADSIKRGLIQANINNANKYQFRFVNSNKRALSEIWKKEVNKKTTLVIGPLDKNEVNQLVAIAPSVPTLALNQVDRLHPNVYQFALSKEEDAQALTKRMQFDGITTLAVLIDEQNRPSTKAFYEAMRQLWGNKLVMVNTIPSTLTVKQGLLLLGDGKWLNQLKLPTNRIYTLPFAIDERLPLPQGLVFCDTPALYAAQWSDVMTAYRQKPVTMPYQRLLAFGGDAWQIADTLQQRNNGRVIEFKGRTGQIRLVDNLIFRQPQCFQADQGTVKILSAF